ncbi:hypothetical protein BCR42DRAFT_425474 [Absidia repens]|uniref:Uncharacterized protein n=1 Tax=Absidia repens TaxID=90262 RepID=A0A1X2I2X4_9FUNG|nr:hypothetical protein BCR42DRAFT_425474 [Absidia repens]
MERILISLTLASNGYIIQIFFSHEPSNCRSNVHKLLFFMSSQSSFNLPVRTRRTSPSPSPLVLFLLPS